MISAEHLRSITAFVHAAESGGFTRASERLGLSRSAVAKSVSRLERSLGVRLFNRTTRRFGMTSEGEAFHESCVRILGELESAAEALTLGRQRPKGRLRIDLPVVFGRRWVTPALLDLGARHPELRMEISLTDRKVDLVEEGIDLAIRIGELEDSAVLIARSLGTQTSVVCASPTYIAAHGRPRSLEEIDRHYCITFSRGGSTSPWVFFDRATKPVRKTVKGQLSFNHSEAILDAALAGRGLALLSTWLVADKLRSGELRQVLKSMRTQGFPIHAVWPQNRHLTARVRVVVDELVSRFLPKPPWDRH